jgi:hypothetical protein
MDINAIGANKISTGYTIRRAQLVSPSRRRQWEADGRCLRCGSLDHWVENYELQAYSPRARARTRAPATIAALDLEETPTQESINLFFEYDSDDPRHPDAWQRGIFET